MRAPGYEVATALLNERLTTLPDRPPTVWENQEQDPAKWPSGSVIALVQTSFNDAWRYTHDHGHIITGVFLVTLLIREGRYTAVAVRAADRLVEHFPSGLRLGKLHITQHASIGPGYLTSPYWRLPVKIPFRYLT